MTGTSARAPLWGLFDPAIRPDPYPLYDELRTSGRFTTTRRERSC